MTTINNTRTVLGGVVASIVLFLASGIINGAILGSAWQDWLNAMGGLNHAPSGAVGMLIWMIVSLLFGLTGVLIYVGIRPRFGSGPKTAMLAGLLLWIAGWFAPALGQIALGAIPPFITAIGCAGGLIAALLAIVAGAALYKEG
jgi:hypothetical protein